MSNKASTKTKSNAASNKVDIEHPNKSDLKSKNNNAKASDQYYNDPLNKQRLVVNEDSEFAEDYKRIKEAKADKAELAEEEQIERQDIEAYMPKAMAKDYIQSVIEAKYQKNWGNKEKELLELMNKETSKVESDFLELIMTEEQVISPIQKTIEALIRANNPIILSVEEKINKEILKELQDNHKKLVDKKVALEEEQQILSKKENIAKLNTSLSKTNNLNASSHLGLPVETLAGKELVEHNIRSNRIKEIKTVKKQIDSKIKSVEIQVKKILEDEEANEFDKKEVIKHFLEHFEKDTEKAEEEVKAKNEDYKKHVDQIKKKEKALKELPMIRKEEEMKKIIEEKEKLVRKGKLFNEQRKEKVKSKLEKILSIVKEGSHDKVNKHNYKFAELEELDRKHKAEQKKKLEEKLLEQQLQKKSYMKPLNREELNDFSKKVTENREKKIYEKEKARLIKMEEIITINATLPKADSQAYQRVLAEKHELKEKHEKEKLDKIYKTMKIHNFSKLIHEKLPPKVDEKKKLELEDRIERLKEKRPKKHRIVSKRKAAFARYKLVKNHHIRKNQSNSVNKLSKNSSLLGVSDMQRSKSEGKRARSKERKPIVIKKPLDKKPNYLVELRIKRREKTGVEDGDEEKYDHHWEKMLYNEKQPYIHNLQKVMREADYLEEQAKMKEKILKVAGGSDKNPMEAKKLSDIKIDAIRAKLAILDGLNITN